MDNVFASIASGVITDVEDKIVPSMPENILENRPRGDRFSIGNACPVDLDPAYQALHVRRTDQQAVGRSILHPAPTRTGELSFNLSPLKDATQSTQGVAIVLDDLTEKKRLEGQRRLFERMVSPRVIAQLDPDKLQLGGKRTQITAMFADVRGFTSYSETKDPETLVSILNRYLAAAADAVLAQEGTIDKFMGDAVMAWFNAPIPQPVTLSGQ
jgi:hypothetical protein